MIELWRRKHKEIKSKPKASRGIVVQKNEQQEVNALGELALKAGAKAALAVQVLTRSPIQESRRYGGDPTAPWRAVKRAAEAVNALSEKEKIEDLDYLDKITELSMNLDDMISKEGRDQDLNKVKALLRAFQAPLAEEVQHLDAAAALALPLQHHQ